MAVASRTRAARAKASGSISFAFQVVTRLSQGPFSEPSEPVTLGVGARTISGVFAVAVRDPRVRRAVENVGAFRPGAFHILYATLRRNANSEPVSGKRLSAKSAIENVSNLHNSVLCFFIEFVHHENNSIHDISVSAAPAAVLVGNKNNRDEDPDCKALLQGVSSESSVKSSRKLKTVLRGGGTEVDDDCSFEHFVPMLPEFVKLPPSQDALVCGMFDALLEEGRLIFPLSLKKVVMPLFIDVSTVVLHLQEQYSPDAVKALVPAMLIHIAENNDTRAKKEVVFEREDMTQEDIQKISNARKNLEDHPLLAQVFPQSRTSTTPSPRAQMEDLPRAIEEIGGRPWIGSKLRGSMMDLLKKFRLWSPNLTGQRDASTRTHQFPVPNNSSSLQGQVEVTSATAASSTTRRSSKRRRIVPLRFRY